MPMRRASSCASAISARGTLGLSAVIATARSASARCAAIETTVLSMPPENATATRFRLRRISSNRSRLAATSEGNTCSASISIMINYVQLPLNDLSRRVAAFEFLQRMTLRRHHPILAAGGPGHFGDIDIAIGIDAYVVRREEAAGIAGMLAAAPASLKFSVRVEDAHAAAGRAGRRRLHAGPAARAKTELRHVDHAETIDEHLAWPGHVSPFRAKGAFQREDLNPA